MIRFRDLPVRRKLVLVILLTSTAALLLACGAFMVYETLAFRREMTEKLTSLAGVTGNNLTAALDFDDPASAAETLAALRAEPHIVHAHVFTADGAEFASYGRGGTPATPEMDSPAIGAYFRGANLHVYQPITRDGETVGTIEIVADLTQLSRRLWRYTGIAALVLAASLLVVFALSGPLARLVSDPILALAAIARRVAGAKDYAVRAEKTSNDEIGQLIEGFNEMLAQIQQRDEALQLARDSLEHRVEERTAALRRAQEQTAYERDLLRALLDAAPDAIYFKDRESRLLRCSASMARALNLPSTDSLLGRSDFDLFDPELARATFADEQEILRTGQPIINKTERAILPDGGVGWTLTSKMPLRDVSGTIIGTMGISKDITMIKQAEEKLEAVHKQLLATSRQAGMAEVATGVLHNVGNVLNSVNVSATLIGEQLRRSEAVHLERVCHLLRQHEADLGTFLTEDPRGRQVLGFLEKLAAHLASERTSNLGELEVLHKNVEHIKEIVAMQQSYAKVSGVAETAPLHEIVEDALRMNAGALVRHDVTLVRDYRMRPTVTTERHKILQILVNLIRNAKYACDDAQRSDKQVTVRIDGDDEQVSVAVIDNGVGIPGENLTRIFAHGFTTRKDGHGFGLHSGALAARELGGSLRAESAGPGLGATFVLSLPRAQDVGTATAAERGERVLT